MPVLVRAADLLAIALIAMAVVVAMTGGFHSHIFGIRLSVTERWRIAVLALIVIAGRHLAFPRPNLLARLRRWAKDDCVYLSEGARRALPMPVRELVLVTSLMVILTCLMTYPHFMRLNTVPDLGDPLFSVWRMAWTAHQLPRDPAHLFDANMFYPERLTLAYSDSMLLPAVAASPFLWLGVPAIIVYNLFFLATFVLAGVAMYALVRALTGQAAPALVAGAVFAFYPFRFEHYSHFELLVSFWIPLVLLALHRTLAFGRIRDGLLMGAAFVGQMYSCMYFGILLAVYLVPFWAVVAIGWRRVRRGLAPVVLGAVLAGASLVPLAIPYIGARQTVGERKPNEVEFYSAVPQDYLNPPPALATYAPLHRKSYPERALFPGIVAVALALIALWPPLSASRLAYGVGLLFAFEASLGLHGYSYSLLYRVGPVFHGLRVPARLSMFVGLSLAALAGYGIARLTRSAGPWVRWTVAGVAVLAVLVETRPVLSLVPVSIRPEPEYTYFNARPPGVLAEVPTGDVDFLYLYASTFHWQRLLNGRSGFVPPSYLEFEAAMAHFPDDRAMALLTARGTDYVMVHGRDYFRYWTAVARAAARTDLREVSRSRHGGSETRLYQIVK